MDTDYTIELVDFRIFELSIKTNFTKGSINLKAKYSVKMAEPQSSNDPTAMLEVRADFSEKYDQISFTCAATCIIKCEPAPSDWQEIVNERCSDIVHAEMVRRLNRILSVMGVVLDAHK